MRRDAANPRPMATVMSAIVAFVAMIAMTSCEGPKGDYKDFDRELSAGNLTEAENLLRQFSDTREGRVAARRLIETYLGVDRPDMALNVYENITTFHHDRYKMNYRNADYETTVCAMLRKYLVAHGDYERAWLYYPLRYESEDYYGNAEVRFQYLCDVVADMCGKGLHDEVLNFVARQVQWFYVHVDPVIADEPKMASFSGDNVKMRLDDLIDNVN